MSTAQEQQAAPEAPPVEIEAETPEAPEAEAPEQGEQAGAPAKPSETEELAIEMGWAPKAEWKGPPESWKSAKEFIRHGTVIQRELKTRNDAMTRDYEQRFQRLDRASQTALANQRKQLDDGWKARMREAVQLGDTDAFDRASQNRETALNKFDEEVGKAGTPDNTPQPGDLPPEVKQFAARNPWFDRDPIMTDVALGLTKGVAARYPAMTLGERLEHVEKEMRRRYPEEFGQAQTNGQDNDAGRAPRAEGGLRPIKSAAKKGWETLPGEAKTTGLKFVKEGLFKTKEDYAASYYEQEQ